MLSRALITLALAGLLVVGLPIGPPVSPGGWPGLEQVWNAVVDHGSDVESLVDILNGGLDAGKAAAKHTDGAGGFFMATHRDDAVYFATRQGPGGVIRIRMSNTAIDELRGAGGRIQSYPPGAANAPNFQGMEFHIPTGAFGTFNRLMDSGDISAYAE